MSVDPASGKGVDNPAPAEKSYFQRTGEVMDNVAEVAGKVASAGQQVVKGIEGASAAIVAVTGVVSSLRGEKSEDSKEPEQSSQSSSESSSSSSESRDYVMNTPISQLPIPKSESPSGSSQSSYSVERAEAIRAANDERRQVIQATAERTRDLVNKKAEDKGEPPPFQRKS